VSLGVAFGGKEQLLATVFLEIIAGRVELGRRATSHRGYGKSTKRPFSEFNGENVGIERR
jgi:hypothetical protein